MPNFKIVIIGSGVKLAKKEMLEKYAHVQNRHYEALTVFEALTLDYPGTNNEAVSASFYQTSGQEGYERLRPLAYQQTKAFIVVFSLQSSTNNNDSFNDVFEKWLPELNHYAPNVPVLLVGLDRSGCNSDEIIENPVKLTKATVMKKAKSAQIWGYLECRLAQDEELKTVFEASVQAALNPNITRQEMLEREFVLQASTIMQGRGENQLTSLFNLLPNDHMLPILQYLGEGIRAPTEIDNVSELIMQNMQTRQRQPNSSFWQTALNKNGKNIPIFKTQQQQEKLEPTEEKSESMSPIDNKNSCTVM